MHRCLDLAIKGIGKTYPNPLVGCVIVLGNKIISEGWHKSYGGIHAEVDAINKIKATGSNQKEILFIRGNAMSGAPIIIGTNQLPNPPIIAGITIKNIMIKP